MKIYYGYSKWLYNKGLLSRWIRTVDWKSFFNWDCRPVPLRECFEHNMIWIQIHYIDYLTVFSSLQEDIVKLQILNLAAKLFITNPKQVCTHVVHLLTMCLFNSDAYSMYLRVWLVVFWERLIGVIMFCSWERLWINAAYKETLKMVYCQ